MAISMLPVKMPMRLIREAAEPVSSCCSRVRLVPGGRTQLENRVAGSKMTAKPAIIIDF